MKLPKFTWQSPDLYRYAGLYVFIFGKKYRIFRVGNH